MKKLLLMTLVLGMSSFANAKSLDCSLSESVKGEAMELTRKVIKTSNNGSFGIEQLNFQNVEATIEVHGVGKAFQATITKDGKPVAYGSGNLADSFVVSTFENAIHCIVK